MGIHANSSTNETMASLHEMVWEKERSNTTERRRDEEYPVHQALAEFSIQSAFGEKEVQLLEWRIEALLNKYPAAIRTFDDRGMLPIHVACKENASLSIIHTLVQKYPESLKIPTRKKQRMLPLHLVCRYYSGRSRFKVMVFMIRTYPKAVEISTAVSHDLPLHLCLQNYFCTLPQIVLLIDNYYDAIHKSNKHGDLPIHIACERQYMRQIRKVENSKKDTSDEQQSITSNNNNNNNGDLSFDIVRYLVRQWPESVSWSNGMGELPIHTAIRSHKSISTIEFLLSLFPKSLEFCDDNGRTGLHLAVTRPIASLDMVSYLYKMEPRASITKDMNGKIPLQYAAKSLHSVDLLYTLIRSNPHMLDYM